MNNYIYKLAFRSAVRFGTDRAADGLATGTYACHSDTLFSALCHEWLKVFGEPDMLGMVEEAKQGRLLISDLFPWEDCELYLPKPVISIQRNYDQEEPRYSTDKKQLKNLRYIPVSRFDEYIEFLRTGGALPFEPFEPAVEVLYGKAAIAREDKTNPYLVSAYRFRENCGLYFIARILDGTLADKLGTVVESLGVSGIGGKKSSGYGKFELYEEPIEFGEDLSLYDSDEKLGEMLETQGDLYMSLSVVSPSKRDLELFNRENSYYTIVPRTGFVESSGYSDKPLKHKSVALFGSGSCFNKALKGQVLDLCDGGRHPVFCYGKGMYLGVKL